MIGVLPAPRNPDQPYRIGVVCAGNICRSPIGDVVLSATVADAGLDDRVEVSSCGTGPWHVGDRMDPRAAKVLTDNGYDAEQHRAQQVDATWLDFDLLLAMDEANLRDLRGLGGMDSERVRLFRDFDPRGTGEVDDPYFDDISGFDTALAIAVRTSAQLVSGLVELLATPQD